MSASNDSTANFLNMLFYYLSTNPTEYSIVHKLVQNDIKKDDNINYYKLRDIDYL